MTLFTESTVNRSRVTSHESSSSEWDPWSGFLGRELGLELREVADRSLALTSRLIIFMSFSTSHFSLVSSRLMINRISDGSLLIKIEVRRLP